MPDGPDPLGKRALYWLPVDEQSVEGDGYEPGHRGPTVGADAVQLGPDRRHARPTGKHALFSAATPAGEDEELGADEDALPHRGPFTVACSSCGAVARVGIVEFLWLLFPVAGWLPGRVFDRWMTCPSCRRRAWMSVTLSR